MFFTAITYSEGFSFALCAASDAFSLALSQSAGIPAEALLLALLEGFEAALEVAVVAEEGAPVLELLATGDPEVAGGCAAGFDELEEQPVAVKATRAEPARSAYCSRFMSR
ncbi:MAG: hypothetical protein HOV83_02105 [Catenulispora sp.]|nr:hypothetical protein [Catenulispora sp.]